MRIECGIHAQETRGGDKWGGGMSILSMSSIVKSMAMEMCVCIYVYIIYVPYNTKYKYKYICHNFVLLVCQLALTRASI